MKEDWRSVVAHGIALGLVHPAKPAGKNVWSKHRRTKANEYMRARRKEFAARGLTTMGTPRQRKENGWYLKEQPHASHL